MSFGAEIQQQAWIESFVLITAGQLVHGIASGIADDLAPVDFIRARSVRVPVDPKIDMGKQLLWQLGSICGRAQV